MSEQIKGEAGSTVGGPDPNAVKSRILDVIAQEIAEGPKDPKSIYSKTSFGKSLERNIYSKTHFGKSLEKERH